MIDVMAKCHDRWGGVLQGAGAEVQRPVYQVHAYPPGAEGPPSTDNTPWGVALGQTLATPRMPEPQSSPPASGPAPGPTPPQGAWGAVGASGDAHANSNPSPLGTGEAALTPTDLLLQVSLILLIRLLACLLACLLAHTLTYSLPHPPTHPPAIYPPANPKRGWQARSCLIGIGS